MSGVLFFALPLFRNHLKPHNNGWIYVKSRTETDKS